MKTVSLFQNPPAEFHPGYFWLLNAELTHAQITRELEDMASHGAKTVCPHPLPKEFRENIHSKLSPDYLSKDYFEQYRWIISECERLGMIAWLYDEGGWPSGRACGKVARENPGKFLQEVLYLDENGSVAVSRSQNVDLLSLGETEEFIRLTHQEYQKYAGNHFGKTIRWCFTDEPAITQWRPGKLPWLPGLDQIFLARKGYDVKPFLKSILQEKDDERTISAKIDYFDVLSQLFVERYLNKLRSWCGKNNLLSGGHFNGEDVYANAAFSGHGAMLRNLRALDIPGVDLIWRQLFPGGRKHTFPKLASSVAAQTNRRQVMAELFGVFGNGITPQEMLYLNNYMLVMGVNSFVYGCLPYSTSGAAKGGERPHFGPVNPLWAHFGAFHRTVARLCALSASGKPCIDTALFFPTRSFWASQKEGQRMEKFLEDTAWKMLHRQCDFDFVDDDALNAATIDHEKLVIGNMRYQRLVIPEGSRLAPETEKKLAELRRSGFPVFSGNDTDKLPSVVQLMPAASDILVRRIHTDDGLEIYFMLNTSGKRLCRKISFPVKAPCVRCDAETGRFLRQGDREITWEAWEMLVFAQNVPESMTEARPPHPVQELPYELKNLRIAPLRQIMAGNPGGDYVWKFFGKETPFCPVALGEWSSALGSDFSGEAVYTMDLKSEKNPEILDLGKVHYAARVILNGRDLGTRLYPPYVFDVRPAWKAGVNHLEVRVTNTLANAIAPQQVQEIWKKDGSCDQESYHQQALLFERESLPSGLFGPIVIK